MKGVVVIWTVCIKSHASIYVGWTPVRNRVPDDYSAPVISDVDISAIVYVDVDIPPAVVDVNFITDRRAVADTRSP